MVGYPFFYGNEELDLDKIFIIFSLDPIRENSKLNLTQAAPLALIVETVNSELGDEFAYQFCEQISQICGKVRMIPETQTLVLDYNGFCALASDSEMILNTISSNLAISQESTMQQAQNFFNNNNILVQAEGVQGTVYKLGSYLQSAGSASVVVKTLGLAKLAGVTGLQILRAQPILVVAIPTTGAIFFYGCGAIVGNNAIGKALVTTGEVLAIPMKGVEIMWNSYGNPVIQKVFGFPVILNMTQAFKTGPGYTLEEIGRYIPLNNTSIMKTVKKKILDWLAS